MGLPGSILRSCAGRNATLEDEWSERPAVHRVCGRGQVLASSSGPIQKEGVMPKAGSKKTPMWEWVLLFILIIVIIVFIVLWATGTF